MITVSLTTLKKPHLLRISLTQSASTCKGNPFLYFQSEEFKASQLFKFKGTKSQIFGPRKDSDSVPL